ncbi:hypothetical protein [Streptomyces sp. SAJ15]|uniref:hypothetical protein n=1 Tax=Streptomyces sp. SAJ15 TaxID=2011095 RepID=UPI00118607F7|nr:hypothetical protein [Streptomyces sp. SAJ15]TVL93772.1 hypothetical protein CD790_01605 [Streptomyces sp. SAJ15]
MATDSTTETGSATYAARSLPDEQDRIAWEAIDAETRDRLPFVSPEDFTVTAGDETVATNWRRFHTTLSRAASFEAL